MFRRITASVLFALLVAGAAAAEAVFEFEPVAPSSNDPVRIQATYHTSCIAGGGRSEVFPGAIRVTAYQGCSCSLAPPSPVEVVTTVEPLPPGRYEVELVVAPDPLDSECDFEPHSEGVGELVVGAEPELISIDPPVPTTEDVLTVTVRSGCPFGVELPSRQGHRLLVTTVPSASLAPCSDEPVYAAPLPVGRLPAGTYSVALVFDDGSGRRVLVASAELTVHPAPAADLLLQGGRFRVDAAWNLANGRVGTAAALPLTADSGAFWFFGADNLEILAKLLDGCAVNGHYWFFAAGLTNVGVTLQVEDTVSGQERAYGHAPGSPFLPVLDTRAFRCP